jgi:alpha-tubulin suppressor-like RCC1 family protein
MSLWRRSLSSLIAIVILGLAGCGGGGGGGAPSPSAPTPLQITGQPQNVSTTAGIAATFNIAAAGNGSLAYQWRRNGVAVAGETKASLVLPSPAVSDNGARFSAVVSDSNGSLVSAEASLTVTPVSAVAPSITAQPTNVTVKVGETATFSVVAIGTAPLTYQWRLNGTNISLANLSSYSPPAITSATLNGGKYSVLISNAVGTVASLEVVLSIDISASGSDQPRRIATGFGYSLAVLANGKVIGWGTGSDRTRPYLAGSGAPIPGTNAREVGISAKAVSGGLFEAAALGADANIYGWGERNLQSIAGGVLGSISSIVSTPTLGGFPSGMIDFRAVDATNSLALRSDGTVWQSPGAVVVLGSGQYRVDTKQVPGLPPISSIGTVSSLGGQRGIVVARDGTVWEVRIQFSGLSSSSAVSKVGSLPPVQQVSCGELHCLALALDGTVWAWGDNVLGTLGNGNDSNSLVPVKSVGLAAIVAIAAGPKSSHAISSGGQVYSWGLRSKSGGVAGTGRGINTPGLVPGLTDIVEIAASDSLLVRRRDGAVFGWGENSGGELGNGSFSIQVDLPVRATGINLN